MQAILILQLIVAQVYTLYASAALFSGSLPPLSIELHFKEF